MKRVVERWRRRLCQQCKDRPARYARRGRVKRRRDHDLCFRCFRSLVASLRPVHPRRVRLTDSASLASRANASGTSSGTEVST